MGLIIAFIILAIIAYVLYKLSFATRVKIAVTFLIIVGLRHSYVAITSVGEDDVNDVIKSYIEKCNTIPDVQLAKDKAIIIFSEAAASASAQPVDEAKSKLYSGYLIQTGRGGFLDVFNYFPAYIAENYLGFNFENDIKQIGIKAGINAVEEATCDDNKSASNPKSENFDKAKVSASNQTNLNITAAPAPALDMSSSSGASTQALSPNQVFEETAKQTKKEYDARWQAIEADPAKFLKDCKSQDMNAAVELGGENPEKAAKQAEINCNIELTELKNCMDKPNADAQDCYDNTFNSGD